MCIRDSANPEDYRIYFEVAPTDGAVIEITDEDSNGMPIGLTTRLHTADTEGDYSLRIRVIRSPDKSAPTAEQAGGEVAIEGVFKMYLRR